MKEESVITKDNVKNVIIAILSIIIVFGGAFFASELKYCKVEEKTKELEAISITNFTTLLNDESASIVYIGRPDCGWCQQQEPIMKQVATEYDLNIFYMNANELTAKDMTYLAGLDESIFGEEFGTPTTVIVQKGEIIDGSIGLLQKNALVSLLKKHGFIK